MMKNQIAIEAERVNYKWGNENVLEDITFSIKEGDYVGLIGPNGAGKTTLIKILLGIYKPSTGKVKLFGQDINIKRASGVVGYVPQKSFQKDFVFPATVSEIIESGRINTTGVFSRLTETDRKHISKIMDLSELSNLKDKAIAGLSGGQQQRVLIARALVGEPKILILDEPTLGVDIKAQERFYDFLENLNTSLNITIIFVTHDVEIIAKKAEFVLCLNRKLVCHTKAKNLVSGTYLEQLYGKNMKIVVHK
jgi:zinc transport system ATP-binding protein